MAEFLQFLIDYGYIVIFVWVLLDQLGLPIPAIPLMLAAGALAGGGHLAITLVILVAVMGAVPMDLLWYYLGKARGGKMLNLLCAISLEPDYCVRNTEAMFNRLGPFALIVAKFLPGLQTLAPPMAGLTGMSVSRFIVLDTLGALLWSGLFAAIGLAFHRQLEQATQAIADFGIWAGAGLMAILFAYIGVKFVQRRRFVRSLRMRRLQPDEAYEMMRHGEDVHVIDLRHSYDFDLLPRMIPSAVRVPMESIERHYQRIPPESDVILYCS